MVSFIGDKMSSKTLETLLIAGDLVPVQDDEACFISGNIENCIGTDLLECINKAKYRICNLEAPLTREDNGIPKCGPNLKINPDCIIGIKKLQIDMVTLANNHILDYGKNGLLDTIGILDDNGIQHSGAGSNIAESSTPTYLKINDKIIGVFCCAEYEFSIATEKSPGAYGFDPLYTLDLISQIKKSCDYLIVLHHGGKEFYRYPSPGLAKTCMRMVDKGADLVVCQHSHCIGCEMDYKGAKIIYGQGNFLFNRKHDEFWDSGLLIKVSFCEDKPVIETIPVENRDGKIEIARDDSAKKILGDYQERSHQIENSDFIYTNFVDFANSKRSEYYKAFLGGTTIGAYAYRLLNRIRPSNKNENIFYKEEIKREIYNYILCEAHREVLLTILNNEEE